ncbi:MAG: NAD(P)-dependent oxidoreductase [Nocardioidaceae bacterium]|nr:NAD(P)-dependent oxidoreductase [Nocardioidaceae bacterium]
MRVLVTGGSGFIGQHVVNALRADGHEVSVVDRTPYPDADVRAVVGELEDAAVRGAAVASGTDAVVHLAAATSVLGSMERPALVHRVNVDVTAGLLELCREQGVRTFVMASTNAVVGAVDDTMTEDVLLAPLTPYGATKAAAEMLMSGYAGAYGLRTPSLRLTNVYGPGMHHKDSFIPRLLRAAAAGGGVQVYGDGRQRRDLVHVTDVARAFAKSVVDWPSGPVIIGSGRSHTVLDLIAAVREATGCPIPAEHVSARAGEMPAVVVDVTTARSRGWEPQVSLSQGVRSAWADFAPSVAL